MDNVLVDFPSAFPKIDTATAEKYKDDMDEVPGIFSLMRPMPNAIESVEFLAKYFDIYILSTAPWENPSAWSDKLLWIKKYLPRIAYKRLILSHNKHLNMGDYLIDDRLANGADRFSGEHIHFGQEGFEDWKKVVNYLLEKESINHKNNNMYEYAITEPAEGLEIHLIKGFENLELLKTYFKEGNELEEGKDVIKLIDPEKGFEYGNFILYWDFLNQRMMLDTQLENEDISKGDHMFETKKIKLMEDDEIKDTLNIKKNEI
jgi:5'(3')-deoxyribonucleotidase